MPPRKAAKGGKKETATKKTSEPSSPVPSGDEKKTRSRKRSNSRSRTVSAEEPANASPPKKAATKKATAKRSRSRSASRKSETVKVSPVRRRSTSRSRKSTTTVSEKPIDKVDLDHSGLMETVRIRLHHDKERISQVLSSTTQTIATSSTATATTAALKETERCIISLPRKVWDMFRHLYYFLRLHFPWGGPLGAFILLIPFCLLPLGVITVATLPEPTMWNRPHPIIRGVQSLANATIGEYFDRDVFRAYAAFFLFQVLLSFIPLGRTVHGFALQFGNTGRRMGYRCVGLQRLIVTALALAGIFYWRKDLLLNFHEKWHSLMVVMALSSVAVGAVVYLISLFPYCHNRSYMSYSSGKCFPYIFLAGPIRHPRLWDLDLKLWAFETFCISWLMLDAMWLLTNIHNCHAEMLVAFHVVVVLALFATERYVTLMDELNENAWGVLDSMGALYLLPWILSMPVCYLTHVKNGPEWPLECKLPIVALFLLGLALFVVSRMMQTKFQLEPHRGDLTRTQSVMASDGSRVLAAGAYKWIRHPQSLGVLLMLAACGCTTGFSYLLPWVPHVIGSLWTLWRICTSEHRNAEDYSDAWTTYKTFVPKRLIPCVL